MKSLQRTDGYWWFSLEANESIGSEFIFMMHYLDCVDKEIMYGIARRIKDCQRKDGSWALYTNGPADLSTSVECYFALKLAGTDPAEPLMRRALEFILLAGGIEKTRVFTKIHLAMFGLVPWSVAPAMPAEFIFVPNWFRFSIYEFSSWARATIVPLLVFMSLRQTCRLGNDFNLDELFVNPKNHRDYSVRLKNGLFSWEGFFVFVDKCLKIYEAFPLKTLRKLAINKCLEWTWEHVRQSEDIYPAMAYAAMAFKSAGYNNDAPQIQKPFEALKMFQQYYTTYDVPPLPDEIRDDGRTPPSKLREIRVHGDVEKIFERRIHQQCCISPAWDTPWMVVALLEAGVPADDPHLLRAGHWLLSKQITDVRGDWAIKNPGAEPGGWSFEFENSCFPDIDDTIEVIHVIKRLALPVQEKSRAVRLGTEWLLSMQNTDGGWGAFDKNQTLKLVNRIPFSDHGACLDPSSPDITGRMLEFLATENFSPEYAAANRAASYIWRTQEEFGGWFARWGINYIYGTWCVVTGLWAIGWDMKDPRILKALDWIEAIQHADGGFGESPASYNEKKFVPLDESVPSQTAWALMALVAGGRGLGASAGRAAEFLLASRNANGAWDEMHHTGTGFPGHFYIRYHGYRHYFPLLALARYFKIV